MDDQVARVVEARMKLRERFLHDVEATPSIAEDSHYGWISFRGAVKRRDGRVEPGVHDGILDCSERESVTFRGLITIAKNRGLRVTVSR